MKTYKYKLKLFYAVTITCVALTGCHNTETMKENIKVEDVNVEVKDAQVEDANSPFIQLPTCEYTVDNGESTITISQEDFSIMLDACKDICEVYNFTVYDVTSLKSDNEVVAFIGLTPANENCDAILVTYDHVGKKVKAIAYVPEDNIAMHKLYTQDSYVIVTSYTHNDRTGDRVFTVSTWSTGVGLKVIDIFRDTCSSNTMFDRENEIEWKLNTVTLRYLNVEGKETAVELDLWH